MQSTKIYTVSSAEITDINSNDHFHIHFQINISKIFRKTFQIILLYHYIAIEIQNLFLKKQIAFSRYAVDETRDYCLTTQAILPFFTLFKSYIHYIIHIFIVFQFLFYFNPYRKTFQSLVQGMESSEIFGKFM